MVARVSFPAVAVVQVSLWNTVAALDIGVNAFEDAGRRFKLTHNVHRTKPMLWWHVHKAAGTYMCQAAQAYEEVVSPHANCNWNAHDVYSTIDRNRYSVPCATRASYFAEQGVTWGAVERPMWPEDNCSEFDHGTLLREPLSLMLSQHNYDNWYNVNFNHGSALFLPAAMLAVRHAVAKRNAPFPVRQLGEERTRFFDNFQVRVFSGQYDAPFGGVTRQDLEAAKSRLQNFRVRGVLEDLASSGDELFQQLGWPARSQRQHTTRPNAGNKAYAEQFRASDASMLESLNSLDRELYEFVRSKRTFP